VDQERHALRTSEVVRLDAGHRRPVLAQRRLSTAGRRDDGDAELGVGAGVDADDADRSSAARGRGRGERRHRRERKRRDAEPGTANADPAHAEPPYATENAARTSVSSTPKNVGGSATLFAASLSR